MMRLARPAKNRPRTGNGSLQVMVVVVIGATLALVALGTDELITAKHDKAAAAVAPNDDEIYTGSILYMSDTSNFCHQWLFDNHNGQFTDNGAVDCERAAYRGALDGPKQWSAARLRVISSGFRGEGE
jgi:hypothetical protein